MLRQAKILVVLIVAAASLGIVPPRDNVEPLYADMEAGASPEPGSEEIGTWDQIVFDENVWKTNCSDVYEHLSDAAGTGGGSAQYTFDINACSAYERDRAAQYGDLGQAPSRGRQKRKMFLHVSKSGGSFFCACGYHNHENQDRIPALESIAIICGRTRLGGATLPEYLAMQVARRCIQIVATHMNMHWQTNMLL
jgi:hypothetical protein